ncbi:MAG TPA: glycosyltransferase family 39 protein, partial [Chitinophagaceae bacterium]|nr:glycosyltransferase family 39 protein [Chitinophagaceae bacterium]
MPGILDNNLRRIGWLFTLCVAWGLILPVLMAKGMFSDAVLYAAVAHNMAKGIGSFWFPFFDTYNVIGISSFHEQPPLAFGIESIFFRILGDSDLVERFYTFLLLGIHMILIAGMWKTMTKKVGGFESVSWLPVLFWITIPVCFWSFSNNMNENTMGVFDVLAVWLAWIFMKNKSAADGFLSAICIVLAALSKGFPGLFPLAVPAIYWIVYREGGMGYAIRKSAFLFGIVLIVFLLVLLYEPARDSLSIYLFQRAFQRISDAHTVQSRYFILIRLFTELLPMMAVAVLFWSGFKLRRVSFSIPFGKESLFFLLCGLSGTLP